MEFQDARSFDTLPGSGMHAFHDPLEVRVAQIRLGSEEGEGWRMTAGRHSLSLGQERLLGSDSEWCNVGRAFDGVRGEWQRGRWRAEAAALRVVGVDPRRPDRAWRGESVNFSRVVGSFFQGGLEVSPQWILAELPTQLGETSGRLSTSGVVWQARLPAGGAWEGEWHWQAGRRSRASAFASSVRAPAPWPQGETEWTAGWMWGSGGGVGADGRNRTFHDLYPAGHNSAGLLDPYAWRNLIDLMAGMYWKMRRGWQASWEDHTYWLASRADGLYVDGGPPLWFAGPGDSRYAGHQTNFTVQRPWRQHTIAMGVAWLHTAGFVQRSGGPKDAAVLFLSWDAKNSPLF
jgi:hypothetical protein